MHKYIGHPSQIYGVEELRLTGGKGDGMRMLSVRNGKGLELLLSLDRCADLARVTFKGDNYGYFAPCGFVAPQYYDNRGAGFLKSFTAGFLTTCGLTAVGSPCTDGDEELPLHGTVSHIPCESVGHWIATDGIHIKAIIRDAALFAHKLLLTREYVVSLTENEVTLHDTVQNIGSEDTPLEILYHCNIGYPLLDEHAVLDIPSTEVTPRNAHAAEGIADWARVEVPRRGYEEMCFYHKLEGKAAVGISNPTVGKGLRMYFDTAKLPCFTEWKMMGEQEYVMGLEPGNCLPDGRDVMRERGMLEILPPDGKRDFEIRFAFTEI